MSPTVCTGQSQKRGFSPTHPFKSKHTSGLAHESAVSVDISLTDTPLSRASPLPQVDCVSADAWPSAKNHACTAHLTVTAGNVAAINLYRRCGFVQFGLEPMAVRVGEEYFDKIHMWREL